jgi:hypothetical protein
MLTFFRFPSFSYPADLRPHVIHSLLRFATDLPLTRTEDITGTMNRAVELMDIWILEEKVFIIDC